MKMRLTTTGPGLTVFMAIIPTPGTPESTKSSKNASHADAMSDGHPDRMPPDNMTGTQSNNVMSCEATGKSHSDECTLTR